MNSNLCCHNLLEFWQNAVEITSLSHLLPFNSLSVQIALCNNKAFQLKIMWNSYCPLSLIFCYCFTYCKFGFLHAYSLIGTDMKGRAATCTWRYDAYGDGAHHGRGQSVQWGLGWITANNGDFPMGGYIIFTSWLHCLYYPYGSTSKWNYY